MLALRIFYFHLFWLWFLKYVLIKNGKEVWFGAKLCVRVDGEFYQFGSPSLLYEYSPYIMTTATYQDLDSERVKKGPWQYI